MQIYTHYLQSYLYSELYVYSVSWTVYFSASLTRCHCWNFVFHLPNMKRRLTMKPVVWKATFLSVSYSVFFHNSVQSSLTICLLVCRSLHGLISTYLAGVYQLGCIYLLTVVSLWCVLKQGISYDYSMAVQHHWEVLFECRANWIYWHLVVMQRWFCLKNWEQLWVEDYSSSSLYQILLFIISNLMKFFKGVIGVNFCYYSIMLLDSFSFR